MLSNTAQFAYTVSLTPPPPILRVENYQDDRKRFHVACPADLESSPFRVLSPDEVIVKTKVILELPAKVFFFYFSLNNMYFAQYVSFLCLLFELPDEIFLLIVGSF
jgi:hypothetical protein